MWNVLQEYIHKHPELFIITNGVQLRRVDVDFYKNVSEKDRFANSDDKYAWKGYDVDILNQLDEGCI